VLRIDLPADLHFEDEDGRNIARVSAADDPLRVQPGAVLVAGTPEAWTWALIMEVNGNWASFRPLTTAEAARLASLVEGAP
jgi:hypothetical protein